jgi:hypothetical protein
MSDPGERDRGLAALLADVLSEGQPDAGLLVRYAEDPGSLTPDERQAVEQHLARSPLYADQLKVVRGFDSVAVAAEARRPEVRARAKRGAWLESLLAAIRRRFEVSPALAWAPVAAVAALLLFLLYPTLFQTGSLVPSEREPSAVGGVPGPSRQVAQRPAPEPEVPAHEAPGAAGEAPREAVRPLEAAPRAPEPVAAPAPSPLMLAERPEAKPPAPEPIVLAMATPTYRAPGGATARLRPGIAPRGATLMPALAALPPEHVGRTRSEQPSLYWYLAALPESGAELEFTIADQDSPDPLIRTGLPVPPRPGLQRIRLSDHGVKLPPAVEYRWAVALRVDPGRPSRDVVALGWIERAEPPASVAAELGRAGPAGIPLIYAESGFWYDALSSLSDLIDRYPENDSLQRARTELLRQAGLESTAQELERGDR